MTGARSGRPAAVVLLSGGLDSATTLALALEQAYAAHALTVDYGQRHRLEIARATEIATACGAESHRIASVDLGFFYGSALTDRETPVPRARSDEQIAEGIPATYVPARNTLFLSLALGWAEVLGANDLFIGANAVDYSGYPDCRPEFLRRFEELAQVATKRGVEGSRIRVHAPLLALTKAQIVREALRCGVDLGRTLSCYDPAPDGRVCGECDACLLRAKGFGDAGCEDPALSRD